MIACPCALGSGHSHGNHGRAPGNGAEHGILIKGGAALEETHLIQTVVLDKTGTITEGVPVVTDITLANGTGQETLLQLGASAEKGSEHPLGEAIVRSAEGRGLPLLPLENFEAMPGKGIEARIGGKAVLLGNEKLMNERGISLGSLAETSRFMASQGKTPLFASIDATFAGIIAVADVPKKTSAAAIARLRAMGIDVVMLTGDNARTAQAIASQVGVDRVLAEVPPQEKAEAVKKLQAEGRKVAMVGRRHQRRGCPCAGRRRDRDRFRHRRCNRVRGHRAHEERSRRRCRSDPSEQGTIRTIKQNLFWAFCYNVLGIPIAAGILHLFGGPLLNPIFAAAAMSLSSVSVVSNALRLRRLKLTPSGEE